MKSGIGRFPAGSARRTLARVIATALALVAGTSARSAGSTIAYLGSAAFAEADAYPYHCALDAVGVLWEISSAAGGLGKRNALYRYQWGQVAVLPILVETYTPGDNVATLRGVATRGRDVYVSAATGAGAAKIFRYRNGALPRETFDASTVGAGYDRIFYGIDVTSDGFLYGGVSANSTGGNGGRIRVLDFSDGAATPGSLVLPECASSSSGTAFELVRDLSLVPGADYDFTLSAFYTSRTAGGVARWNGGTQRAPQDYAAGINLVSWGSLVEKHPFGIQATSDGGFWAAKSDSATGAPGVWVRHFTSGGAMDLTLEGDAPELRSPADVAAGADGLVYVTDSIQRLVHVFQVTVAAQPVTWGRLKALYRP